jgi:hypothetical protein
MVRWIGAQVPSSALGAHLLPLLLLLLQLLQLQAQAIGSHLPQVSGDGQLEASRVSWRGGVGGVGGKTLLLKHKLAWLQHMPTCRWLLWHACMILV